MEVAARSRVTLRTKLVLGQTGGLIQPAQSMHHGAGQEVRFDVDQIADVQITQRSAYRFRYRRFMEDVSQKHNHILDLRPDFSMFVCFSMCPYHCSRACSL